MKVNFNKLQDIDKNKTPFKVPDNYFENFNEEIMNLLPEKSFKRQLKLLCGTEQNHGYIWLQCFWDCIL